MLSWICIIYPENPFFRNYVKPVDSSWTNALFWTPNSSLCKKRTNIFYCNNKWYNPLLALSSVSCLIWTRRMPFWTYNWGELFSFEPLHLHDPKRVCKYIHIPCWCTRCSAELKLPQHPVSCSSSDILCGATSQDWLENIQRHAFQTHRTPRHVWQRSFCLRIFERKLREARKERND